MNKEIEDLKLELKKWKRKYITDKPIPWATTVTQLHEFNDKCVLEITAIPTGETKGASDLKQWMQYALIKHFDHLLENNDNPIYERILANRKLEMSKQEHDKKHKEELKQTRKLLQYLCEDSNYSADLITERVIHEIREIERYLTDSVYGDHCSNYNHGFEEVLKLRDLAFKIAKLIKSEMNFPEKESEDENENFRKGVKEMDERRKQAQCELIEHFINLQKLKYEKQHKEEN